MTNIEDIIRAEILTLNQLQRAAEDEKLKKVYYSEIYRLFQELEAKGVDTKTFNLWEN